MPGALYGTENGISKGLALAHPWSMVKMQDLVRHRDTAGIQITRTTLITLPCISNKRELFKFSGSSGHRASYPSYAGLWTVEWPIGSPAVVTLSLHDLFTVNSDGNRDTYPPSVGLRVDRCIEMLAGVINDTRSRTRIAFPGRKAIPGRLEFQRRGFAGYHGSRPFFNMSGGKFSDVDLLFWRNIGFEDERNFEGNPSIHRVSLPSLTKGQTVQLFILPDEYGMILNALDLVPWAHLSWSMHRGMRDILLAVGKPIMDRYRERLAITLRRIVESQRTEFWAKGWGQGFVARSMPSIVYSTVMAGGGDSGDVIRALTDAALVSLGITEMWSTKLDRTTFWSSTMKPNTTKGSRESPPEASLRLASKNLSDTTSVVKRPGSSVSFSETETELTADAVIALTKFVVLEWSQELDYQLYHDLPMTLLLV